MSNEIEKIGDTVVATSDLGGGAVETVGLECV